MDYVDVTELANKVWATDDIKQVEDIDFVVKYFRFNESRFKSLEEACAYEAQYKAQEGLMIANQKIDELKEELKKQEAIVCSLEKTISKLKKQARADNVNSKLGRPFRSSEIEGCAKKFMSQWVLSLIDVLQAKNHVKLVDMISVISSASDEKECSARERKWRRWSKGESIPTHTSFNELLSAKILHGEYAGAMLKNVPVTPGPMEMLALLQLV